MILHGAVNLSMCAVTAMAVSHWPSAATARVNVCQLQAVARHGPAICAHTLCSAVLCCALLCSGLVWSGLVWSAFLYSSSLISTNRTPKSGT